MTTLTYTRLAALIFAIIAALQLARAVLEWSITVEMVGVLQCPCRPGRAGLHLVS